jgi:hypothetical protein
MHTQNADGDRDAYENQSDDLPDPAALCPLVRSLASQAHKALKGPARSSDQERYELHRQIVSLQTQLDRLRRSRAGQFDELQRWLGSLLRYVEHHDLQGPSGMVNNTTVRRSSVRVEPVSIGLDRCFYRG